MKNDYTLENDIRPAGKGSSVSIKLTEPSWPLHILLPLPETFSSTIVSPASCVCVADLFDPPSETF